MALSPSKLLRPGFARTPLGVSLFIGTLTFAVIGQFSAHWQVTAIPLILVALYGLLSGDQHLPGAEGDQQRASNVEKDA